MPEACSGGPRMVFCEVLSNLLSDLSGTEVVSSLRLFHGQRREPDPHWGCCLTLAQSDSVTQFWTVSEAPGRWASQPLKTQLGKLGNHDLDGKASVHSVKGCALYLHQALGRKVNPLFTCLINDQEWNCAKKGLDPKSLIRLICLELESKEPWKWRGKGKVPPRWLYSKIQN